METDLKKCSRCQDQKPLGEFRLLKSGRRTSHCKSCAKDYLNAWRAKNAEVLRERRRVRYGGMTPEDREEKRRYNRERYSRVADRQRDERMKRLFGIGLEEYDALLSAQNGACFICRSPCISGRRLAVDHCHKSGKVRGLLCGKCNRGIGAFDDDPKRLVAAAEYLRTKGAPHV